MVSLPSTRGSLIDVSPLFKYIITGREAAKFVDRLITRDVSKMAVGQVYYTPWCDERGRVIDDGTVSRLEEHRFRWTAADPNLRWLSQNAIGMEVAIEDVSESVAAVALQGPTSAALLRVAADADIDREAARQRLFGALPLQWQALRRHGGPGHSGIGPALVDGEDYFLTKLKVKWLPRW